MDSVESKSFGRLISNAQTVEEGLQLEVSQGKVCSVAELDALVGRLLLRSLRGERIVEMNQDDLSDYHLSVLGLNPNETEILCEWFSVGKQQARGSWAFPDKASLRVGFSNVLWLYNQTGRFGTAMATEDRGRVKLTSTPAAVFYWALLESLFDSLCLPLQLRGLMAGEQTREQQLVAWAEIEAFYSALGFAVQEQLSVLRYGGGWHRLNAAGQLAAKRRLFDALASQANIEMASRYRVHRSRPLILNYYKKAKRNGLAKRKQVVSKELEKTLCAYWGGDWLSFLDYLGEEPHPEEQIVTALPKVKPLIRQAARIEEIAASQGLAATVIASIAASYWQETGGVSHVEARVQCLRDFWGAYDEIHVRQKPAMKPLWGLVNESRSVPLAAWEGRDLFQQDLFRELLPEDLIARVLDLWSGSMLARWPDRIGTEPFPYVTMVETLGSALSFWDGCSLTAWFLCEGPSSRTDMSGLAHYHRREIAALEAEGTPIDQQLFADLIEAEKHLGPPESIEDKSSTTTDYGMFSVSVSRSVGSRRKGFEKLRDVITRHSRAWTQKHLEEYLKNRWESEITHAGRAYNLLVQSKEGKVPSVKQFAKAATPATNHWFGGDVCGLYGALREKCPERTERIRLMPRNVSAFARSVFDSLTSEAAGYRGQDEATRYSNYIEVLANLSIRYVQLEEALGRPPIMKELGERFVSHATAVNDDTQTVWTKFIEAIASAATTSRSLDSQMIPIGLQSSSTKLEALPVATPLDSASKVDQEQPAKKHSWWQRLTGND